MVHVMRRARSVAFLACVLLLPGLPMAAAGTEASPEVQDARGDTTGSVASDLLAVWLETTSRGVRVNVKVNEAAADHVYALLFTLGGKPYVAAIGLDGRGNLDGHVGAASSGDWGRGGWERAANGRIVDLSKSSAGPRPIHLRGTIPWGEVSGLEPDATLSRLSARSDFYNRERGSWFLAVDEASSQRVFTVPAVPGVERSSADGPSESAVWPRLLFATFLGALLGLLVLLQVRRGARRRPAASQGPAAPPAAPEAPPAVPEGSPKLRLDPRE